MLTTELDFLRRAQLTGVLEAACQALELSPTQLELAEQRYMAIGSWLAEADDPLLRKSTIYPQGSIALQTMVKPIGGNEHDVDLVCLVPMVSSVPTPRRDQEADRRPPGLQRPIQRHAGGEAEVLADQLRQTSFTWTSHPPFPIRFARTAANSCPTGNSAPGRLRIEDIDAGSKRGQLDSR